MFPMLFGVVGVDENVVQVDKNANVKEVREDVIHEALERSRRVRESKGHNHPFEGAVTSAEGGFPFISFVDLD